MFLCVYQTHDICYLMAITPSRASYLQAHSEKSIQKRDLFSSNLPREGAPVLLDCFSAIIPSTQWRICITSITLMAKSF